MKPPFTEAVRYGMEQVMALLTLPSLPFGNAARPGYMRGIDWYSTATLPRVIGRAMSSYKMTHGRYPDLVNPMNFNEKVVKRKFFGELKFPESGNKLNTAHFIPDSVSHLVSCPDIVWVSEGSALPDPQLIEPGLYYLKANHGSDMNQRVEYPLHPEQALALSKEFGFYLQHDYGLNWGEWWYSTFPKKTFLERNVTDASASVAWLFYVFRGKIGLIAAYRKTEPDNESSWLDSDFALLDHQNPTKARVSVPLPSPALRDRMKHVAAEIGRDMDFARVDLMIGNDGALYLSEITFAPSNGLVLWPDVINDRLGEMWAQD